jgi:hypothetical protein
MVDPGEHESEIEATPDSARPGLRVVTTPEPELTAADLALRVDADTINGEPALEAAVAASQNSNKIDEAQLAELRRLADELGRARRIRSRTRAEVTDTIARKVAGSTGVEVHSSTLRDAAAAVTEVEAELEANRAELAALTGPIDLRPRDAASDDELPAMFDEEAVEARRVRGSAVGVAVGAIGLALILAAVRLPIVLAVVVGVVGIAVSLWMVRRHHSSSGARIAHVAETSERLAQLDVLDISEEERRRVVRRTELDASIARLQERLRSSLRQWSTVAGPDANPHDIESVLRARDPQYDIVGATATSPTIRAVDTMHRRATARWRVAWAALGVDEAPDPADLDHAVAEHNERVSRALVLVDPVAWLSADRLAELLQQLPAGRDVYLVRRG